jgi:hypothetical protein
MTSSARLAIRRSIPWRTALSIISARGRLWRDVAKSIRLAVDWIMDFLCFFLLHRRRCLLIHHFDNTSVQIVKDIDTKVSRFLKISSHERDLKFVGSSTCWERKLHARNSESSVFCVWERHDFAQIVAMKL